MIINTRMQWEKWVLISMFLLAVTVAFVSLVETGSMFYFAAFLGVIASVFVLRYPDLLIYFWVFFAPFSLCIKEIHVLPGISQSLYGVVNLFTFPVGIAIYILYRDKFRFRFLLPLFLYLIVMLISLVLNEIDLFSVVRTISAYFNILLIASIALAFIKTSRKIDIIIKIQLWIGIFICLHGIVDYYFFEIYSTYHEGVRRIATFEIQNSNVFSLYIILMICYSLGKIQSIGNRPEKLLYQGLLIIFVFSLVLTFSVSGWVAGLVLGLFYLKERLKLRLILLIPLFTILIIAFNANQNWRYRNISYIPQRIEEGGTYKSRVERIWPATIRLIEKKPIFGHSPEKYANILSEESMGITSTHNTFLGLLISTGVLGLVLIIWMFWRMERKLNKLSKHPVVLIAAYSRNLRVYIFSIMIYGVGHSMGIDPQNIFMFWISVFSLIGIGSNRLEQHAVVAAE